jgi:hypothetical protein
MKGNLLAPQSMPGMDSMGSMGGLGSFGSLGAPLTSPSPASGSLFGDSTMGGGSLGGLDVNSIMKQMSEQQKVIQNLLGE